MTSAPDHTTSDRALRFGGVLLVTLSIAWLAIDGWPGGDRERAEFIAFVAGTTVLATVLFWIVLAITEWRRRP